MMTSLGEMATLGVPGDEFALSDPDTSEGYVGGDAE